ncbi:MAG: hypothetical protein NC421_07390 [Lachnospiraceae bacterium]|nr:hypothetical protein [Lachnospiraceae bacterium]
MKTLEDFKKLIPILVDLVKNNDHEIGESCYERYEDNYVSYDEDGWLIEVSYRCSGEWNIDDGDYLTPPSRELICAWGEITEITASHYDEDTEEESEFSGDELEELWNALSEELKDIA